ncbi:MAG: PAS domain-containing sensor histidine kinase [Prolixibacteraceae bacterium]|nr:PAS domain-containing sensor histidine kinase [Prolixibacteraceae bacterium]
MKQKDTAPNYDKSLFSDSELYLILFEHAGHAIFFTEGLIIIDCNRAACALFQFSSKGKAQGNFLFDFSPENQSDGIPSKEKYKEFLATSPHETLTRFEWEFLKIDGTSFIAMVIVNSFIHEQRSFQQFTIHDITFLKDKEKIIQENESKYKKIFENVQDVFYQTDLNGIITEISPSIERYSKYIHSDVKGKAIDQFYANPDDRIKLIAEIKEKGEAHDFEVLLKGRDNQAVWGSVNAHFTFDKSGKISGIEGTIRDLTDRKEAEEKSERALSLLQATLDSAADGILVVNRSGKITNFNKQFKQMFNHTDEALESGEDSVAIEFVLEQLTKPQEFISQIKYLYDHPELESLDTIELKDGRTIERFSCPQLLDGEPIGRVWNFRDVTEQRRSGQQLQLMAHTLKSINESISITDTNNRILFLNAAFLKTYGYPNESELIGEDIAIVRSEENDKDVVDRILSTTAETGWQGEIMNRKKDGTSFPISLSTSIVQDENGKTLGMVGVATDISERKLAEKALQDKEAHLSTLVQTIPDLIWLKDVNGVYITCNKMFENFFGASETEIVGKTDYDFVEWELADSFRKNDLNAIAAGKPTSNEEWITFASDGHQRLLETIKVPMYDSNGTTLGVLGIGRDITARKQAEERLLESEIKYRTLIESMPDGVYRSTPEGKFVEVNPAMVKLLGYSSKEELMAINIKNDLYFNPEDRESLILELNPEELDVYPLKRKDGSAVWVEDHGWYAKDENGNILFHEGISRDVTDRKIAEMQMQKYATELQELNATKDKFFSIIAHDLKTPFNSILGLSEILKEEAKHLDIATIEQYSGIIHSTSKNTFRLLENLLEWARIQQSQILFHPVSVQLKNLVNEVVEFMVEKANSKMIAVINYIPDGMVVYADKDMLKTILRNLISNALKFTSTRGKIEIKAISKGSTIEILVFDTGTGISKDDMAKIFRIDSNFTKDGTENEKGTGLGLLLCKEFVEKHGGKIWVESEVGKGSTFIFTLSQDGQTNT